MPVKNKKNLLVTLADEKYLDGAKQVFGSAYFNGGWDGDMMLLAYQVPAERLEWFRKRGILIKELSNLDLQANFLNFPTLFLYKLSIFKLEFRRWDRIIFLDADVIVRYSLRKLLTANNFSAVADAFGHIIVDQLITDRALGLSNNLKEAYNLGTRSFNSGVLVFPSQIIKDHTYQSLISYFEKYGQLARFADQSILNLFFYKQWTPLAGIFNVYVEEALKIHNLEPESIDGVILHFVSVTKPWYQGSPFYKEWRKNLIQADNIGIKPTTDKYQNQIRLKFKFYLLKQKPKIYLRWLEKQLFKIKMGGYQWGYIRWRVYDRLNDRFTGRSLPDFVLERLNQLMAFGAHRKISIIITTKDRLKMFKKYAWASLQKLDFDPSRYEIVVVDNGRDSETFNYLIKQKMLNLKAMRESRAGASYGRNKGIEAASGDIVAFIDDDCEVDKDWLTRIYNFYSTGGYLAGRGLVYDEKFKKILNPDELQQKERLFAGGNMSFRRSMFRFVAFNEVFTLYFDEYDLISQIDIFWPNFPYFTDYQPIKHWRAESKYRDKGEDEVNYKGIKLAEWSEALYSINKKILKRNLNITSQFFIFNFLIKEISLLPLEIMLLGGRLLPLIKTKIIIYRQLHKLKSLMGNVH